MRVARVLMGVGLGGLLLVGCGKQKAAPPKDDVHVIPEYKSASEAIKKQLPLQEGMPGAAGTRALQRELEQAERSQARAHRRAESAGAGEGGSAGE